MNQAVAFAIAREFCRKRPFARNYRNEDETFAISFTKPFAFAGEFLRNAWFAAFCLRFGGYKLLANFRGASEFAFAFAALSLRLRSTQKLRKTKSFCGIFLPGDTELPEGVFYGDRLHTTDNTHVEALLRGGDHGIQHLALGGLSAPKCRHCEHRGRRRHSREFVFPSFLGSFG